jgi:hypothetical protein
MPPESWYFSFYTLFAIFFTFIVVNQNEHYKRTKRHMDNLDKMLDLYIKLKYPHVTKPIQLNKSEEENDDL